MKVNLTDYANIDLDRDVWKTFVIVATLKQELKLEKIPIRFIMSIRILENPYPFQPPSPLNRELIDSIEKTTRDHIKLLKSHGLIELNEEYVSIPSKHDILFGSLRQHLYLSIQLPLQSFYVFDRILPHGKSKYAIFTNRDDSFTSLSRGISHLERGLFIKILIDKFVFSGIIRFDEDLSPAYKYLDEIRSDLKNIGIIIDVLEKMPIQPISLFPFFTTGSEIYQSVFKTKKTSTKIDNLESYLQNWFNDYLKAYHEITLLVPRMNLVDPNHNKALRILVMLNKSLNGLSIIHYLSNDIDKVEVKILEKIPSMEEIFSNANYQSDENLLHASQTWAPNVLLNLGNPYMEAMKNIAKRIEEFDKKTRTSFDVSDITNEKLIGWIKEERDTKRYLIEKLRIEDTNWKRWLQPMSIIIDYSLNEPKPSWRRSGNIYIYYLKSDSDIIEVKKMDYLKTVKELTSHSPGQSKFLSIYSGDLLHFMMEIMGEHSKIYF